MKLDGESSMQEDTVASETQDKETSAQNSLSVNKRFVVNTLKQVDDHNRIKTNIHSKLLRKFQNEQRKKHTLKNLTKFSPQKTLYSDFFEVSIGSGGKKRKRSNIITPLEQVKKLISNAAEFDQEQEDIMKRVVRKPRFSLDKTLLNNHLKHYSVHNRLKEENEMWDKQHSLKKRKPVGLQSQSSKRSSYGGMYADREPSNIKVSRVKQTPDNPHHFGDATRELLDLKESMPDRWGHSGFKETYKEELNIIAPEVERPEKMSSRKIVISSRPADRLNTSIELSDDEVEVVSLNKTRKVVSHVVSNASKGKMKKTPVQIVINEPVCVEDSIEPKKKSVVMVAPKKSKHDTMGLVRDRGKKTLTNRTSLGTLQADLILNEEMKKKAIKRAPSPKWGHDGFKEISGGNDDEDSDSDYSDETQIDSLKRRNRIDRTNRTKQVPSSRRNKHEGSDYEWTEKKVTDTLPENDARRKLKQNKTEEAGLTRTTVRNSLHRQKSGTIKSRLILPEQGTSKNIDHKADNSVNDKRKLSQQVNRKRMHSEDDVSSFTDSSSDERYKKKVELKKMRHKKFHIDRR